MGYYHGLHKSERGADTVVSLLCDMKNGMYKAVFFRERKNECDE
jgi:hypothetical protein